MSHFVGLDVSQKITAICVVDKDGRRIWRGQCPSVPEQISAALRRYAGDNARIRRAHCVEAVGVICVQGSARLGT
jgi:transposase